MEIKQIWMSPSSGKNNHYALHLSLGVVGIVLLMLLLISFGIVVSFSLGLPRKATAMGLCVACTILALVLARRLGRYAVHGCHLAGKILFEPLRGSRNTHAAANVTD